MLLECDFLCERIGGKRGHMVEIAAAYLCGPVAARRKPCLRAVGLVEIVRAFGDRAVRDGALDRAALAAIVFHDPAARAQLDAIVHPYVFAMARAADRQARAEGARVVVHDIPLLVEAGGGEHYDLVVAIAAPEEIRVARLVEGRGLSPEDALARIRSQASDAERAAAADSVLDGSGTADSLRAQVDEYWQVHVPAL